MKISKIEYFIPRDTIAVGEESQVKLHVSCANLDPGTKIKVNLRDRLGLLGSRMIRALSGSGELTFRIVWFGFKRRFFSRFRQPASNAGYIHIGMLSSVCLTMPGGASFGLTLNLSAGIFL